MLLGFLFLSPSYIFSYIYFFPLLVLSMFCSISFYHSLSLFSSTLLLLFLSFLQDFSLFYFLCIHLSPPLSLSFFFLNLLFFLFICFPRILSINYEEPLIIKKSKINFLLFFCHFFSFFYSVTLSLFFITVYYINDFFFLYSLSLSCTNSLLLFPLFSFVFCPL